MNDSAARTTRTRTVLLALDDRTTAKFAVVRAAHVARAMNARLHAVVALTRASVCDGRLATLAARLRGIAPDAGLEVELRVGRLSNVAIRAATSCRADLVVVSPDAGGDGSAAVAVSENVHVPVLVARAPRNGGTIVAATDLTHRAHPVLETALSLGEHLQRSVTFFHNAATFALYGLEPGAARPRETHATATLERLRRRAGGTLGVDVVIGVSRSMLSALMHLASERDADVIAIGHRGASWVSRSFRRHRTRMIIDRCHRSVLVVPVRRSSIEAQARLLDQSDQ